MGRSRFLQVRLSEVELAGLKSRAVSEGVSVSDLVRGCLGLGVSGRGVRSASAVKAAAVPAAQVEPVGGVDLAERRREVELRVRRENPGQTEHLIRTLVDRELGGMDF